MDRERTARDSREQRAGGDKGQMDDKIAMGRDCVENLRECVSRLANKQTKIAERTEEASAVTGRGYRKDRRRKDGFWYRERQTTRKRCEE